MLSVDYFKPRGPGHIYSYLRSCTIAGMSSSEVGHSSHVQNDYKNRVTLFVYYGMRLLVLLAIGLFLWRHEWASAVSTTLIFLLMFVPSILKERYRVYLPFAIDFSMVLFIFLTFFLGAVGRFYDRIPLWDKFLHFQSGLLFGASGFVLLYILNEQKGFKQPLNLSPGFVAFFAITFSLSIGAVWEMFEFAGDAYFSQHITNYSAWQASNSDTMFDLIADGTGALIVSIMGYFWMHRYKRIPFTPRFLQRFGPKPRK
ncbi:MAG: hypothetical protein JWM46_120 [Candidatus Kaiserbacteria bacterium]|nr:hypothetical protein [Candidatus Kaiserbacteria bacterium]